MRSNFVRGVQEHRNPSKLDNPLATIEEIFQEKLATSNWLALVVPNPVILNLRTNTLHHLHAQPSIHPGPCSLICRFLKHEFDNLDECPTILLVLRFVRPFDDLI